MPFVRFLSLVLLLVTFRSAHACSTYKVTANGTTMVGSNYDSWLEVPRIWFETNGYGAAFSGARPDGDHGFAPQTGLNEHGLAFVTLATATPANGKAFEGRLPIISRTEYLKDILHTCKNIDEVKDYIDRYDHSVLSQDVFLYVDSTGRYLVAEPYAVTMGDDPSYVLANFCPSTINDLSTIKQRRYVDGTAFLKNKLSTSLAFCTALSDTMHVCREKLGDGTLLTSILDLNKGIIHLFFYHDYAHRIDFDLKDELAKDDHFIELPGLFPHNADYNKLLAFKTPINSPFLQGLLLSSLGVFSLSAVVFLFFFFRKWKTRYAAINLLLVAFSMLLAFYMVILATKENMYYFPAPYSDGSGSFINLTSYIPFLLLALILPLLLLNRKAFKEAAWRAIPKWTLALNTMGYVVLIGLFWYWGFYNVFR